MDAAIGEYLRIVEAQPRDWNSANALGDLYVKSKQVDKGIDKLVEQKAEPTTSAAPPTAAATPTVPDDTYSAFDDDAPSGSPS